MILLLISEKKGTGFAEKAETQGTAFVLSGIERPKTVT